MGMSRGLLRITLPSLLCILAGCSRDRGEDARSAQDERATSPIAASDTAMTPAARQMEAEERRRQSEPLDTSDPTTGAAASMDCPVDVAGTDVAVMTEGEGISMVFKLDDPNDTAALEALRERVRGLAERYRSERMAAMNHGEMSGETSMTQDLSGDAQPGETTSPETMPGAPPAVSTTSIAVTVQDTEDGAKIIVASANAGTLDVLRARLSQDAQIMTQTGSCPW